MIAVNSDPASPVFQQVDLGVVEASREFLPQLMAKIKAHKQKKTEVQTLDFLPRAAAAGVSLPGRRSRSLVLVDGTVATRSLESQHAVDNGRGAAYSGPDGYGAFRAVEGARSAFHARIPVGYSRFSTRYFEHAPRADSRAHGAAGTCLRFEFQGYNVFEVHKPTHKNLGQTNMETIQKRVPSANATTCAGTAALISFFTPEREVKVEQPVKFMAR
jgi:hypothetical protein